MDRFDTLQSSSHDSHTDGSADSSLLVFILDTNPLAWSSITGLTLNQALADILIFINAHLALSHQNEAAIIASHIETARYLYPSPASSSSSTSRPFSASIDDDDDNDKTLREANAYRPFLALQDEVLSNLKHLLSSTSQDSIRRQPSSMMSGAITLALSYINRKSQERQLDARIMILSISGDLAFQYIPMMNCIFSAQKQRVVIDIAKVGGDAVFLQQASDATKGIYHNVRQGESLLTYFLMLFLPNQHLRQFLNLPHSANVDFRAACFCHKRVLDVGFVCSVCLSIFCQALPKCITCDATFDMQEMKAFGAKPAVLVKKKKKSSNNNNNNEVKNSSSTLNHKDSIVID